MEYKKSDLTKFAQNAVDTHHQHLNTMYMAEEISLSDLGKAFRNGIDEKLLMDISKRYAKYIGNTYDVDLDNTAIQNCQNILN